MALDETFPRQYARTRRFTLGRPRAFQVTADGTQVLFLRTRSGTDPVTCLWSLDVAGGTERVLVDPAALAAAADEADLPPEERARRERMREAGGGVVAYATDRDATVAVVALAGRVFRVDLAAAGDGTSGVSEVATAGPAIDPRPDPTGRRVAYVTGGALHVGDSGGDHVVVAEEGVTWGLAEFVAAEELERFRGYWWSPDGEHLLVARVDESPVQRWWISDPARPQAAPTEVAYPKAGTPNADVRLAVIAADGSGDRVDVTWDRDRFEYLATVSWGTDGPPLLLLLSRDQRDAAVVAVDPADGRTTVVAERSGEGWVDVVDGVPAWAPDGRLLWVGPSEGTYRLELDGEPLGPVGVQVRGVLGLDADGVVVRATRDDPAEVDVLRISWEGAVTALTSGGGVRTAAVGAGVVVRVDVDLAEHGARHVVTGPAGEREVVSHTERPVLTARPELLWLGERRLRAALLRPTGAAPGRRLPVLMTPYGGPHHQEVVAARDRYLNDQWLADQGFAVLKVDGRGTPGRGPAWERAVAGDLATYPLQDQVDGLRAAGEMFPELDLGTVAISGWSFGGFLSALAVLRRPDVFHAAVAGAPVTDMQLYDTAYTERYLGTDPDGRDAEAYRLSRLLDEAPKLSRPLMIIHGLVDDNVVAAHSLLLSSALMAAGRPHTFLPLSGVTHMAADPAVAENLLLLQVDFLWGALGLDAPA